MKRVLTLFITIVLCLLTLCACTRFAYPEKLSDRQLSCIQTEYDRRIRQMDFQGAVYTVYQGEEIYSGGAGKALKADDIDNAADVVYEFASVTKQFTAAAILMLYDEGKLEIEDTLDKYFPDYVSGKEITIHHLLCMRSGIPDYVNRNDETGQAIDMYCDADIPFEISEDRTAEENRQAIEEWIFSMPLLFPPGDRYDYSSSNYMLLGEIVSQVSGEDYHDFVQSRIFDRLKMTSAGFVDCYDAQGFTIAKGYHSEGNEWADLPGVRYAAWDLMCTPKDMAKWGEALINGDILSEKLFRMMTADRSAKDDADRYGYGLKLAEAQTGERVYYHDGHFPSFYSMLVLVPDAKLVNVTVSNHSSENASMLNVKLCEVVMKAAKGET